MPEVLFQHAEEAAFLWIVRCRAVRQPHYDRRDLAKHDGLLEAHLDGLRVAGDAGLAMAEERLDEGDAGEVSALAALAVERGDEPRLQRVLEKVSDAPALRAGLVSALGWAGWERSARVVSRLLSSPKPALRAAGIRASAVSRRPPGPVLEAALRDHEPSLAAAAARAAGELGSLELVPLLESYLEGDEEVAIWAAWSAALPGSWKAVEALADTGGRGGPRGDATAATAARAMELARRRAWFEELSRDGERAWQAAVVAGAIGDPAAVPWLLEAMRNEETARVAGEAFSGIFGIDLTHHDLEGPVPEGFEEGPTDDPRDENVEIPQDEDLPWPASPSRGRVSRVRRGTPGSGSDWPRPRS